MVDRNRDFCSSITPTDYNLSCFKSVREDTFINALVEKYIYCHDSREKNEMITMNIRNGKKCDQLYLQSDKNAMPRTLH